MLRDVALELVKKIDIGEIDQKNEKIINLGDPTAGEDAVNMKFVNTKIAENGISATSRPKRCVPLSHGRSASIEF